MTRSISRPLIGVALGMSLSAFATQAATDEKAAAVVAEIGGQKVTRAEVEQKQAARLLQARYQYYLAERDALDRVIDEELIEMQARREHVSVEQLLQREVVSQVSEPTENELQLSYERLKTNEPFAAVREKILAAIHQIRLAKARAGYLESLRGQARVRIALSPPDAEVALDDTPRRGSQSAPVLVVEFADYQCPYCQTVYPELQKLQKEFGDNLAFAFKDFPLPMHANAQKAAEAARCAGAQGRFWDFHDALFSNGKKLELAQLKEHARTLGLDQARFNRCLDSSEQAEAVQKDLNQAQRLGLTGTPSFFVNGHFLSGAVKYGTLREVVEQQLLAAESSANHSSESAR
jgi:protein-disulfide isomerase